MAEAQAIKERSARPSLARSDYYSLMRGLIDSENQLSNTRVIWLLIAEAFFVGGYATLLNVPEKGQSALFAAQHHLLFWLLPIAALVAAAFAYGAILASTMRVRQFEVYYKRYEEHTAERDTSTEWYPPLQDEKRVHALTSVSLLGLPILFILTWAIVLIVQIGMRWFP